MSDYSKLRPLGNRILVRRWALPEQSESGIYILGRDYPTMGDVLAVGNGPRRKSGERRSIDITVGDIVQWHVGPNFDLTQLGPDLFLFNYNDLNFVGRRE